MKKDSEPDHTPNDDDDENAAMDEDLNSQPANNQHAELVLQKVEDEPVIAKKEVSYRDFQSEAE